MTSRTRDAAVWGTGALAASLVCHVLSILVIPAGSSALRAERELTPEEIELFLEMPPPEVQQAEPTVAPRAPRVEPRRADEIPAVADAPAQTRPADPVDPPDVTPPEPTPPEPTQAPAVAVTDPRERPPETTPRTTTSPRILDTRAVARSVLETDGPRMPRAADTSVMDVETPEQRDQRLAGNLDSTLRAATAARPEGFGRRVLPEPVRRPDGSLAYALGQVTAIVNRDGTFTFDDTSGVDFEGMGNAERTGGMTTRWGLEEWMMRRHGNDPHAATRRWFAEQTESMRDEMMQRHIEAQARSAARGMRGRMARLLADETRPIAERRRALFEQWDGCSESELVGDAVRAAIVDVIRERLPEGSPDAYGGAELDEMNRRRESTAEFRPYAH